MDTRIETWNRYELKANEVQNNISSFDEEMKRVDKWLLRNSAAMADLISVRENLLELYVKDDIKTQKNQRKAMKIG